MHPSSFFFTLVLLMSPVLPSQAQGRLPDPIAYSCYFCTEEEMEQVAIDQGVGEHYVYDARNEWDSLGDGIFGYIVTIEGGIATATRFKPENWLKQQYAAMIRHYSIPDGTTVHDIWRVRLLPPDSGHGRLTPSYILWGHHTTALNPLHARARETLLRWISANVDLGYLGADQEHGRVLQFWFQKNGRNPTLLRLHMGENQYGHIDFFYDRSTGQWVYRGAHASQNWIQENASDFAGPSGKKTYSYSSTNELHKAAFLERSTWASVAVVGEFIQGDHGYVDCEYVARQPVCTIRNR